MNTNAIAHAPAVQGHGRPDKAEKAGKTIEVQTTAATAVEISLSEDAQAAMTGPGKSANSPAHQARALLAEGRVGEDYKNFGQLVSSIARGIDVAAQPDDPGDGTVEPPADGGETPVADAPDETGDPVAPAPDDEAAAPVEAPGDEDVIDEIVADDTPDPVVAPVIEPVVDPVSVEDELLEALDEGGSEEA